MSEETPNLATEVVPGQEVTATPDSAETSAPADAEHQEPRTFTQEELDQKISEQKAKIERKLRREMAQAAEEAQRQETRTPPNPDSYNSVAEYIDALADFKTEEKLAEREQRERQTKAESSYSEREEETRAKYDDFEQVAYNPSLRITTSMKEIILESDIGPELLYHLGSSPREAARIASMTPLQQAREIGRIEANLSVNPPVKKVSSAPEPIKPVGSRASTPAYSPSDPRSMKNTSMSEWAAARNKEVADKLRAQQG